MEKHIQPIRYEINAVSDEGIIEGYASVFETRTSYGQVFKRGAFADLAGKNPKDIKVLFNHDWDKIVGVPLEIREDSIGLYTKTQLLTRTPRGLEMYELAKAGALDAFSIGFYIDEMAEDVEDGERTYNITKATVMEYSLVTFPANPAAKITRVNSVVEEPSMELDGLKNQCDSIISSLARHGLELDLRRVAAKLER